MFRSRMKMVKLLLVAAIIFAASPSHAFRSFSFWKSSAVSAMLSLFAGNIGGAGNVNGTGADAAFQYPQDTAVDSAGNVYVADALNYRVQKITSAGVVTTLAGSGNSAFTDGTGTAAEFVYPNCVAVDSSGNVYVGDNNTLRKITPAGVVTTLAGSPGVTGGADGTGAAASFSAFTGLAVDASGNIFVADTAYHTIRKVTPAGVVTTFAGSYANFGYVNGVGGAARFDSPYDVAVDGSGNVYVADSTNFRVRKITPAGSVSLLAGSGAEDEFDGTGAVARFGRMRGITVNSATGDVFVGSDNHVLRKITSAGVVTTLAGSHYTPGAIDGTGSAAQFNGIAGLGVDSSNNLFVADSSNNVIRKVTSAGVVTTFAGAVPVTGANDATGAAATFNNPLGLAKDASGNIYVADTANNLIRKISPTGDVTTFAGSGVPGSADGLGVAAEFNGPTGVAVDGAGNVYVTDTQNYTIRKIDPAGNVTTLAGTAGNQFPGVAGVLGVFNAVDSSGNVYVTAFAENLVLKITSAGVLSVFAGSGQPAMTDGTGTAAEFFGPSGIAINAAGDIYVAEFGSHSIRKITPAGVVTTFAGNGTPGNTNGTGTAASFILPMGLIFDSAGNLYVADQGNNKIRKITPGAVVTDFAGSGNVGSANGTGVAAEFYSPTGIGRDSSNNIYVSDAGNHIVRKITPAGVVTTLAGTAGVRYLSRYGAYRVAVDSLGNKFFSDGATHTIVKLTSGGVLSTFAGKYETQGFSDGTGALAEFMEPDGIAIDASDNIFVADRGSHRIRKITPAGVVSAFSGTGSPGSTNGTTFATFTFPTDVAVDASGNVFVADSQNHLIRKITSAGVVTTLAGSGSAGFVNGTGAAASFNQPNGVAVDTSGNVYVADSNNHAIRKITAAGVVTTLAGSGAAGFNNATGTSASFDTPIDLTVDGSGVVFVVDLNNEAIRRVSAAGVVTTFAGNGTAGFTNGTGTSATFSGMRGMAFDGSGNLIVAEIGNGAVRSVTTAAVVTTLSDLQDLNPNGTGPAARFNSPFGVAVNSSGDVFVSDSGAWIRKITSAGVVTIFAGQADAGYADGTGGAAQFNFPYGLSIDGSGNLFLTDTGNAAIRQITPGAVTTTFKILVNYNAADGSGPAAQFASPWGIAVDGSGDLFVTDQLAHQIRKVTAAGLVTTIAGRGDASYADGNSFMASFDSPYGIAVDPSGDLIVADFNNHRIRKITPTGVVSTIAGSGSTIHSDGNGIVAGIPYPTAVTVSPAGNFYVSNGTLVRKITAALDVTTVVGSPSSTGVALGPLPGSIAFSYGLTTAAGKLFISNRNGILQCPLP